MNDWPHNLVEPQWLATHLDHPQVRVVDCRYSLADPALGRRQYDEAHIPGAVHADLGKDLSGPAGPRTGRHPLPDAEALAERLAAWGISSGDADLPSFVVAYDDAKLAFAARLWWMLKYLGHDNVAVLNGGWSAWRQLGLPASAEIPRPRAGQFTPGAAPEWLVDYDEVAARLDQPGMALLDSRSPERHRGLSEPIDPVAGTIPGSTNFFSENVVDENGRMKPPEWLTEYWRTLDSTDDSVVFCGSGVTACVNVLSQALAGRTPSRLYVGGWSEWCRRNHVP